MASVSGQLLEALDNLVPDQLKKFKWHLRNDYRVSASDLEKTVNASKTVDLMMARFGPEEAVKNTVKIPRKMKQNLFSDVFVWFNVILICFSLTAQAKNSRESESINETPTNIVPTTRNDLLQYSLILSLDLNTVNKYLDLSQNNTVITGSYTDQQYPDHPDRFDECQVLCGESVSGRSYWEIEWRGRVEISVSYKSISRKGWDGESWFGYNRQSWSLFCSPSSYSFRQHNRWTDPSVKPIIIRRTGEINDGFRRTGEFDDDFWRTERYNDIYKTGVFVDPGAGTLSFFSVSINTVSLILTVQTTFTETLYPGFYVGLESSVKLC